MSGPGGRMMMGPATRSMDFKGSGKRLLRQLAHDRAKIWGMVAAVVAESRARWTRRDETRRRSRCPTSPGAGQTVRCTQSQVRRQYSLPPPGSLCDAHCGLAAF